MDTFEIGMRFPSYKTLMESIEEFSQLTQSKFWKRDARTITASRSSGIQKYLNPQILYYEIKFSCVYGGVDFKSKGKNIRNRNPSLKVSGCPAFLRFKASEDGEALQLVAINLNHNHELKLPIRKTFKRKANESLVVKQTKRLQTLQQIDNIEIEQQNNPTDGDEEEEEEENDENDISEIVDCLEVQYDDFKMDPNHSNDSGLIAPVFTPFNDDLHKTINFELIPSYAEYLLEMGITGVLVNGTTGEGTLMTVEERKLVTNVWAQICAQTEQSLMVQVGGAALPDVISLAQHAEQKGANSILCLPELYHKPKTVDELIKYLKIVGEAAPNTPLLYYHIPSFTNVDLNMGSLLNNIKGKVPTFSGIKFTSTNLEEGMQAVNANDRKFSVFLGADTIMAGAYTLGFNSAIATTLNILPDHGQKILHFIKEESVSEARAVQDQLNNAIEIITKHGAWVPTMKQAMNLLTPIKVGPPREPLTPLNSREIKQMVEELKSIGLFDD